MTDPTRLDACRRWPAAGDPPPMARRRRADRRRSGPCGPTGPTVPTGRRSSPSPSCSASSSCCSSSSSSCTPATTASVTDRRRRPPRRHSRPPRRPRRPPRPSSPRRRRPATTTVDQRATTTTTTTRRRPPPRPRRRSTIAPARCRGTTGPTEPEPVAVVFYDAGGSPTGPAPNKVATDEAVDTLFDLDGTGAQWTFQGCSTIRRPRPADRLRLLLRGRRTLLRDAVRRRSADGRSSAVDFVAD